MRGWAGTVILPEPCLRNCPRPNRQPSYARSWWKNSTANGPHGLQTRRRPHSAVTVPERRWIQLFAAWLTSDAQSANFDELSRKRIGERIHGKNELTKLRLLRSNDRPRQKHRPQNGCGKSSVAEAKIGCAEFSTTDPASQYPQGNRRDCRGWRMVELSRRYPLDTNGKTRRKAAETLRVPPGGTLDLSAPGRVGQFI